MAKKKEEKKESFFEEPKPGKSGSGISKVLIYILILIIVISVVGGLLYFGLFNKTKPQNDDAPDLVIKIGKLVELPADEAPELATVSDKSKLAGQPFFDNAQNGDKVLIYSKNRKAILYRPSTNKIINISFVNESTPVSQEPPTTPAISPTEPSPTSAPVKAVILNGTKTAGLAKTAGSELKSAGINIAATTGNAVEDHDATIVVDITGKNNSLAAQISKSLGGKVGSLPEGEQKPQAEILIILGQDYIN